MSRARDLAEAWFFRRLRTIPALVQMNGKIYPMLAPPSAKPPFAVYNRRSTDVAQTFMGPAPMYLATFSLSVFAGSYQEIKTLVSEIRKSLDGFVGFSGGTDILGVLITSETDTLVSEDGGELLPFYGVQLTVEVRVRTLEN